MCFIKLTLWDGKPVLVNMGTVTEIYSHKNGSDLSFVAMTQEMRFLQVQETQEQIEKALLTSQVGKTN